MSKAVIVGEKSLVLGFAGAGVEIVPVNDDEAFHHALGRLSRQNDVALVLTTESLAVRNAEVIAEFRENARAILTVIPTHHGSNHASYQTMRETIEKSIGVDLLK